MIRPAIVHFATLLSVAASCASNAADFAVIDVGSQRQLIFDGKFADESEGMSIVVNPPKKLGPVLRADHDWEDFRLTSYFTVVQDGEIARMYYSCFSEDQWSFADAETTWRDYAFLCYAESKDGLTWQKPELGIVEYNGSKANNILARSIVDGTVFIDPSDRPSRRYKMLHTVGPHSGGLRISTSTDGIHFELSDKTVAEWGPDSQQNMFFDPRAGKYVAYLRARSEMGIPEVELGDLRSVVRVELDEVGDWSGTHAQIVLAPDDDDPPEVDFYTNACVKYPWAEESYFMFPALYHHFAPQYGNDGLLDIAIAASRDGVRWHRPDRHPYVSLGENGDWDSMFEMMGVGLVRKGDKVLQYYCGVDFGHGGTRKESQFEKLAANRRRWGAIGALEQRLDGFYSADADYAGGWLTTPPIVFDGGQLEVNINTSSAGSVRIEIRDAKNQPIEGFGLEDADVIMTNDVHHRVTWHGNPDVSRLAGRSVRIHFSMRSAKLFAFQFLETNSSQLQSP
jgi:hypothetical protein